MFTRLAFGQRENTFVAIAALQSHRSSGNWQIIMSRPFRQCSSNTIQRNEMAVTAMIGLLFFCRPTHIVFFIMPVLIRESVQSIFQRWSPSKMFQKLFKRCEAKLYAPSAIVFVSMIVGIVTSGFSVAVRPIFRSRVLATFPVGGLALSGKSKKRGIFCIGHSVFSFIENGLIRNAERLQNSLRSASIIPQMEVC